MKTSLQEEYLIHLLLKMQTLYDKLEKQNVYHAKIYLSVNCNTSVILSESKSTGSEKEQNGKSIHGVAQDISEQLHVHIAAHARNEWLVIVG